MWHGGVCTSAHPLPSAGDPPCRDTLDKAPTGPEGPELSKALNPSESLPLNDTPYRSLAAPLPPQMYFLPSILTFFPVCTSLNASTEIRFSAEDFFCPLGLDDLGSLLSGSLLQGGAGTSSYHRLPPWLVLPHIFLK